MARHNNPMRRTGPRRGRWAEAARLMIRDGDYPDLPDVGSGADPTSGEPAPFKHKAQGKRRRPAGGDAR